MEDLILIHNPNCSKSRAVLELLENNKLEPKLIKYLETKLTKEFLSKIFLALNMKPKEVLRMNEDEFKQLDLDLEDENEVIEAIIKYPKILERPILIKGTKAVIGRPPENIFNLI